MNNIDLFKIYNKIYLFSFLKHFQEIYPIYTSKFPLLNLTLIPI